MLSFTSKLINLKSSVWSHGMIVPLEIAEQFLNINDKRVICVLNKALKIHAALMPKGDNTWFINLNKDVRKTLQILEGDTIQVDIQTDDSKYGMEAPEEFLELLRQDLSGKLLFDKLTMGKQRALIQIILKLKSSQKRIEKSIIILEYLKDVGGQLDFKEVHLALKNSRY